MRIKNVTYDNPLIAEVVTKKTEIFLSEKKDSILPNPNYLSLIAALSTAKEITSVVDFGGAAGIHYELIKSFLPKLETWNVIETSAMVEAQKRKYDPKLKFETLVDFCRRQSKCDFLYMSGSLPYVEDPIDLLVKLMDSKPEAILISRTAFNTGDGDVKFIQTSNLSANGPGPLPSNYKDCKIQYEANVPNYNQVIDLLEEKYSIQWTCSENEEILGPDGSIYPYLSILAKSKNL